ncbi:MAG TPA: ABC transporter permease, partial [Gemmatimonadales bacterium]|nr:ABC transporter permease [Gemmatimonadales bacterium]
MDTVFQDLRYALRTLRRTPVFTLIAVLTLATAIGANTAIFSVLNGVVLRPLQYDASDRLFGIWERSEGGDYRLGSYPTFRDWRAQSDVFEALAYIRGSSSLIPSTDGTRQVGTAFVSDEFFDVLKAPPLIGRVFSREEQQPGGPPVAVLT